MIQYFPGRIDPETGEIETVEVRTYTIGEQLLNVVEDLKTPAVVLAAVLIGANLK